VANRFCGVCGGPIRYVRRFHGYIHDAPLGMMRVSRREAQDIHADPPRYQRPLHRQTVLHPAILAGREP
jgi:hypothetical protein